MMHAILALAALSAQVSAQFIDYGYLQFAANSSAPSDGFETFQEAAADPEASNTVMFDHDPETQTGQGWTWTLAISNVSMPNITDGINDDNWEGLSDDTEAHVAFTTYSFSWPEEGNVNQAVDPGTSSCLFVVMNEFPQDISDAWDPSSPDCASALGEECVEAIQTQLWGEDGDCSAGSLSTLGDACAGSFASRSESTRPGVISLAPVEFENSSRSAEEAALQANETFAWALSPPYAADNATTFQYEKSNLRVIGLSTTRDGATSRQLLCNRVGESSSDDGSQSTDADEPNDGVHDTDNETDGAAENVGGRYLPLTLSLMFASVIASAILA